MHGKMKIRLACIEHKKGHGMCVLLLELRRSNTNSPAP